MIIRVEDVPAKGLRLAGTVAGPADGRLVSGPIAFALQVTATGTTVFVDGWMHAVGHVPCDRCLQDTRIPVDSELDLEFRAADAELAEEDKELDEEDLTVEYYPGDVLDLRAVLAQQVFVGIPMKALCDEDCSGLCPQCGIDRNRESCDCEPPPDPRLAGLAELRDQL